MFNSQAIENIKTALIKEYRPVAIYIFGSYAWGHPDDESDLDLLIVVEKADEDRIKMLVRGYLALSGIRGAKELVAYTKDEFDELSSDTTRLSYKIKHEGKLIYGQA